MHPSDLEKLARVHAFPAVSVLLPVQRELPGNPEDPLRLRSLIDQATERLLREHDRRQIAPIIEHLNREAAAVDFMHPGAAVVIFATEAEAHTFVLPFPVRERVVINETFAVRDLVRGLRRLARYRVLVLSGKQARLLSGAGGDLQEARDAGFPLELEAPREEDTPHRDLPIHESQAEEAYRFMFRAVDRALGEMQGADPLPVVLVGVERDLAYFREVSRNQRQIVAQVTGSHVNDSPAQLGALVAPVVAEHFERRAEAAVGELVEAIGRRRAALGVEEVWTCAREGRGHRLLVEEDFRVPARVVDDRLATLEAPVEPTDLDDAVDEITDAVLVSGGDIVVVPPDTLAEQGHIGLVLRY